MMAQKGWGGTPPPGPPTPPLTRPDRVKDKIGEFINIKVAEIAH